MVFSVTMPAFGATPLNDHMSHWAKDTIQSALSSGIANGYPDGSFKPNNAITRAEFFALTNNVFGFTGTTETTYTDVPSAAWYAPVIAKAETAGYISGYPDRSIHPKGNITRQEVAAIIGRLKSLGASSNSLSFTDASSIPSWSKADIIAVSEAKIMNGYPDGSFKPTAPTTRAEALIAITKGFNHDTANTPNPGTVKIPVSAISVTGTTTALTAGGSTRTLTANISPITATNKSVTWSSSNTAVATVVDGVVTPVAAGVAVITVTTADGSKTATYTMTVKAGATSGTPSVTPVSGITVTQVAMTLTAGEATGTIIATITPSNATNQNVIWISSDINVATVANGVVTPIAAGTALISATSAFDGTKVATTAVTVLIANQPLAAPVNLGLAGNYAILSKTAITSVPDSVITGNIGVSPIDATAITGFSLAADPSNLFARSTQVTGKVYAANYASPTPIDLTTAISNLETAYTDAAGRAVNFTELHSGDLSGKTLAPGVYKWGTGVSINSDVTLNGGPNDVWIFQIGGGITQASGTKIILAGGAQAKNIFWQTAQTVSIGTDAHFEGIVLSMTNITMATHSSINGRLLAQTAVTLDKSTVVAPN